jgi:hypothetical protein
VLKNQTGATLPIPVPGAVTLLDGGDAVRPITAIAARHRPAGFGSQPTILVEQAQQESLHDGWPAECSQTMASASAVLYSEYVVQCGEATKLYDFPCS